MCDKFNDFEITPNKWKLFYPPKPRIVIFGNDPTLVQVYTEYIQARNRNALTVASLPMSKRVLNVFRSPVFNKKFKDRYEHYTFRAVLTVETRPKSVDELFDVKNRPVSLKFKFVNFEYFGIDLSAFNRSTKYKEGEKLVKDSPNDTETV